MVSFNIVVVNATGSAKQNGELYLASGIIKYEPNHEGEVHFSSIASEIDRGKKIIAKIEEEKKEVVGVISETPKKTKKKATKKA